MAGFMVAVTKVISEFSVFLDYTVNSGVGWNHQRQEASNSIPRNTLYVDSLGSFQWLVSRDYF